MLFVCYSYVTVCYSCVLVCTRMLLVCTRMLLVCSFSHDHEFQPGCKTQICVGNFTEMRKQIRYACSRSFSSTGLNSFLINYIDFLRIFQPGLKPSPCNRHLNFKRISFRTQAEISARLTGLEFANVITPNTKLLFSRSAFSRSTFSRHPL